MLAALFLAPDIPPEEEPDDRLEGDEARLVRTLTDKGMPELVETLLADHPTMHRVFVARAYAQAGIDVDDARLRERFFQTSAAEYRKVIALETDPSWFQGERRRLNVAQWRVELADLILRRWAAPDLDRFEITSGLDFQRERLVSRLREAHAIYVEAQRLLDDLRISLENEEEPYLLLGIADTITTLHEQCRLNCAWAAVYLALVGGSQAPDRENLLHAALGAFDAATRSRGEASLKYNALLGAGIALRESKRYDEAVAVFDRVRDSTAPASLIARASYEKVRSLMLVGRFGQARKELDVLAAMRTDQLGEGAGVLFYVRLVPVIRAYTYILEAQAPNMHTARRKALQDRAVSALTAIAQQGGPWPGIVEVYLDHLASGTRNPEDFTDAELRLKAGRYMTEKKYKQAVNILRILVDRPGSDAERAEARFNLGVCLFQARDIRAAASAFLSVAGQGARVDLAERAARYAYQCWSRLAKTSNQTEDYAQLAEAARIIVEKFPEHDLAAEADWVLAVALQEAGDYQAALLAYATISPTSQHYWQARRNAAQCRQRLYETLTATASLARRRRAARSAASAWLKLVGDLEAIDPARRAPGKAAHPSSARVFEDDSLRREWIADARLAAAALLACDDVRAYQESLALLDEMPPTGRVLSMQIRCYRGLGDLETAGAVLGDFIKQAKGAEVGAVLLGLAAEMEAEVHRLRAAGRHEEADQMATDCVATTRQLLDWVQTQPHSENHQAIVRFSLAKVLIQVRERDEAMAHLQWLMARNPDNGTYLRTAALLQEDIARAAPVAGRQAAQDKAESLWARLLEDRGLRERAPAEYWEARYHWLRHQLRHGRAAEVAKGIEIEQAWYPDLGGPPWQSRLLELAAKARAAVGSEQP